MAKKTTKLPPAPEMLGAIEQFKALKPAPDVLAEQALSQKYNQSIGGVTNPSLELNLEKELFSFERDPYARLKYDDFVGTTEDVNYKVADRQSWAEQWLSGLAKFVPSVALKTAATAGDVLGAITESGDILKDILTGETESAGQRLADIYENPLSASIRKADEWLKSDFWKIYNTREYDAQGKEGLAGLISKLGTAKFWAEDVADGAAYATSAYLTGNALAGLKIGANLGNMFKAGSKATKALTQYGDIALATAVQTLSEASAEASGVAQSVREQYTGKTNPNTGELYTDDEINTMAGEAGKNTFIANSMVLLLPNIIQSKFFLGKGDSLSGGAALLKSANSMDMAAVKASTKGATAKAIATGIASEGLWEENIQLAIQNYETSMANDPKGLLETITGYGKNMIDNLGTTEGLSSIFIGSLIGSVMGGVGQHKETARNLKSAQTLVDRFNTNLSLYKTDRGHIDELLSSKSQDTVNKLLFQSLKSKKLFDAHTAAAMRGDEIAKSYLESQAIAIQALDYLSSGQFNNSEDAVDFLKWQIETSAKSGNEDASSYQRDMAAYTGLVSKLKDYYEEADSTSKSIASKLGINEAYREAFTRDYRAAFYGELAKNENLRNQQKEVAKKLNRLGDRQVGNTGELYDTLTKLIEDSEKSLKEFSDPSKMKQVAKKYSENAETIQSLAKRHEELKREIEIEEAKAKTTMNKAKPVEEKAPPTNDPTKEEEAVTTEIKQEKIGEEVPVEAIDPTAEVTKEISDVEGEVVEEPVAEPKVQEAEEIGNDIESKYTELLAIQYKMMELQRREGIRSITDGKNSVLYMDQFVGGRNIKARSLTPLRKADEYFFNVGQEVDKLEKLNRLLDAFKAGKASLEDLLKFATSITSIPSEQAALIDEAINTELDKYNEELLNNPGKYDIIDPVDGEVTPVTEVRNMELVDSFMLSNPEAYFQMYNKVDKIRQLQDLLALKAEEHSDLAELLSDPEKARDRVNKMIAEEVYELPEYIIGAAIDEDGEVRDTYTDANRVAKAIQDVANRIGAMTYMINNNQGNLEFNKEHKEKLEQYLNILQDIELAVLDNSQNRNSKQNKIAAAYARGFGIVLDQLEDLANFGDIAGMPLGSLLDSVASKSPAEGVAIINGILARMKMNVTGDQIKDLQALYDSLVKEVTDQIPNSFFSSLYTVNPKDTFASDIVPAVFATTEEGMRDSMTPNNSRLLKNFVTTNNVIEFRDELESTTENLRIPRETAIEFVDKHIKVVYLKEIINQLTSEADIEALVINEVAEGKRLSKTDNTPSLQQIIAIRQIATWYGSPNSKTSAKELNQGETFDKQAASLGPKVFQKIAYLEGTAGTGKTSIVLKWALKALKLQNNQVVALAPKNKAVEVIGSSTGLGANLVYDFLTTPEDYVNDQTRLIVVDEFGMLTTSDLLKVTVAINNINAERSPENHIKLLMLGDRTQIKQSEALKVFVGNAMAAMVKIDPLTIPFRTNVGAISDFYNLYQGVTSRVTNVNVTADKPVGQAGATGVHAVSSPEELLIAVQKNIEINPNSSKVIIVGHPSQLAKYEGIEGVEVMTADDAQSSSYDEVYMDIDPKTFSSVSRYNSFVYTAASRARNYIATVNNTATNTTLPSITDLAAKEEVRILDNRKEFVTDTKRDLSIIQQIKNGKEVIETAPPVVITDVQEVSEDLDTQEEEEEEIPVDNIVVDEDDDVTVVYGGAAPTPYDPSVTTIANPERGVSSLIRRGIIKAGDEVITIPTNRTINGSPEVAVILHRDEDTGNWNIVGRLFEDETNIPGNGVTFSDFEIGNALKGANITDALKIFPGSKTSEIEAVSPREIEYSSKYTTISDKDTVGGLLEQILDQIYNHGPQSKEAEKSFKIVIPTRATAASLGVNNFKLKPGVPYAIFNAGKSTQVAIRLQPRNIRNTDHIITDLKEYRDAALALQTLLPSNMPLGSKGFEELVKVAKAGLEVAENQIRVKEESVPAILEEIDRVIQSLTDSKTVGSKSDGALSALKSLKTLLAEDTRFEIINAATKVASLYYGLKPETELITKEEFEALNAADPIYEFKESKADPEKGYAVEKVTGHYRQRNEITAGYGPAQIALNNLAKANRFAGNKIIRTQRVFKRGDKITSLTSGKSLISSSMATEIRSDLIQVAKETGFRKSIKDTQNSVEQYAEELRAFINSVYESDRATEFNLVIDNALNKGITYPVDIETLDQVVGDANFNANGEYQNAENPNFILRVPLNKEEFDNINALGLNPIGNKEQLNELLRTNFSRHTPARIRLKGEESAAGVPTPTEQKSKQQESIEKGTTTSNVEQDIEVSEQEEQIAQVENPEEYDDDIFGLEYGGEPSGLTITEDEAQEVFTKMLPNASKEELKFVSQVAMREVQPTATWGLFKHGNVYVQPDTDGRINNKVLRHEIFHKIYAEYLTNAERAALRKEIDPRNELNYIEVEERMAERFEDWVDTQKGSNFLQTLFNKILSWFGLTSNPKLDRVFRQIEKGAFVKKSNEPLVGGARNYTAIRKTYGNASRYKEARKLLLANIEATKNDTTKGPFTFDELLAYVKGKLKTGYIGRLAKEKAAPGSVPVEQLELLKIMSDDKGFNNLVQDIFPSISSVKAQFTVEEIEAMDVDFDEDGALQQNTVTQEEQEFSMRDHTEDSENKNQETTITAEAKLFLSNITFRDSKGVLQRVNPRFAYFKLLQVLNGVVTDGRSIDNIIEQINENHNKEGVSPKSKLIVKAATDVIGKAYSSTFLIDGVLTALPKNGIFENANTYIYSPSGVDLRSSFNRPSDLITVKRNGRTDKFIEAIVKATGQSEILVKESFRNYQDKEIAIALLSNMTSQRESNPFRGRKENRIKEGGRVMDYYPVRTFGKEMKFEGMVIKGIQDRYDDVEKSLWALLGKSENFTETAKAELAGKLLKALGIDPKQHLQGEQDPALVSDFLAELGYFRQRVEATKVKGAWVKRKLSAIHGEEVEDDVEIILNAGYYIELSDNRRLLRAAVALMANNTEDYRATSFRGTDGKSKYIYHLSSWGFDLLERVQRQLGRGKQKTGIPDALNSPFFKHNPLLNRYNVDPVFTIIDHDSVKTGLDYSIGYSSEKLNTWQERKFALGFLSYLSSTARKSEPALKYIQYLYTISNKPRIAGAELELLREDGIRRRVADMVNQHISRVATDEIDNYNKYKFVNQDALKNALFKVLGTEYSDLVSTVTNKKEPGSIEDRKKWYTELARIEGRITPAKMSKIQDAFMEEIDAMTSKFVDSMALANPELPQNNLASKIISSLIDKRYLSADDASGIGIAKNDDGSLNKEAIMPVARLWVANNYVNGFFLNQLVIGDSNYFKDAKDVDKRLSGVFAPGLKGIVGQEAGFMRTTARIAIANDPTLLGTEISDFMKNESYGIFNMLKGTADKPGEVEFADAQGFITPARAREISAGFGEAYSAGGILKPAVYEYREIQVTDAKTGEKTTVVVPFMLKYSAVELSDDLVNKFPALRKLREKMEEMNVAELVMKSGNKVGTPVSKATLKQGQVMIPEDSIREISNANYRLQLNPKAKPYSKTTHPTQITYFMNVLHNVKDNPEATQKNLDLANRTYASLTKMMQLRSDSISSFFNKRGKVKKSVIKNTLKNPGDERVAELLEYLGYNMPHISTKAIIQLSKVFERNSIETKYPGSKFVLQSSWGIDFSEAKKILEGEDKEAITKLREEWSEYGLEKIQGLESNNNRLEYKVDEHGNMYAEVIMPKVYKDKVALGDYITGDMLGFRIPSTELHSGVPLKVVGFYDSRGTNAIIAPAELVALHGSDFDVDALYVISRSIIEKDIIHNGRTIFKEGTPIGYTLNENGYYDLDYVDADTYPAVIQNLEKLVGQENEDSTEVITKEQLFRIKEGFHKNVVVESFLTMMSMPENRERMLKPISMDRLKSMIPEGSNVSVDLSDVNGDQTIFLSNFGGRDLTGMMANLTKGIAYISRAGTLSREELEAKEKIRTLTDRIVDLLVSIQKDVDLGRSHAAKSRKLEKAREELAAAKEIIPKERTARLPVVTGEPIYLGDSLQDPFTQMQEYERGNESIAIVDTLDSLVNAAIDNVKEQILQALNITNYTGKMWAAGVALGIPLPKLTKVMLQPVAKYASDFMRQNEDMNGLISTLKAKILEGNIVPAGEKSVTEFIRKQVFEKGLNTEESLDKYSNKTPEDFANLLKEEKPDTDMLLTQYWIASELEKLRNLGAAFDTVAKAVNTVQQFDVFYPDIERRLDKWNKLGEVTSNGWIANPEFPFEISGLGDTVPHLIESKQTFEKLLETIRGNFVMHSPAMENLVNRVSQRLLGLRFGDDQLLKERLKQEAMHYLISSYYNMEDVEPYTYTGFGDKQYTLTGAEAWAQRFLKELETAQKVNRAKPREERNEFLDSIVVKNSNGYLYADFKADKNQTNEELLTILDAFDNLSTLGEKATGDTFSTLQRGLAQYSVVAYGLSFGMRSYSSVIDPRLLIGPSNYIDSMVSRISKVDENGNPVTDNWIENFELQLALNNAERLPYIRTRENGEVREDWKKIKNEELSAENEDSNGNKIPVYSGVDVLDTPGGKVKVYYDLKYSNNLIGEQYERGEKDFPMYIQQGSGSTFAVFKRISDVNAPYVYYKKVGNKNFNKLYDVPSGYITGEYTYKAGALFSNQLVARAYNFKDSVESTVAPEIGETVTVLLYSDKSLSRYKQAKVISTPYRDRGRFVYKVAYLSSDEVNNQLSYSQEVERYYNEVLNDMAALDISYEEFIEMSKNHTDLVNFKAEIQEKICH